MTELEQHEKLDLNEATFKQTNRLDGIGPKIADLIID